jgi:hypothetical protein
MQQQVMLVVLMMDGDRLDGRNVHLSFDVDVDVDVRIIFLKKI